MSSLENYFRKILHLIQNRKSTYNLPIHFIYLLISDYSPEAFYDFVLIGILTVYKGILLYLSYLNQKSYMGYILYPRHNLNFSIWNPILTKTKLKNERWSPIASNEMNLGCYYYFWDQKISTALHVEKWTPFFNFSQIS